MKKTHSAFVLGASILGLALLSTAAHAHFVWATLDPAGKQLRLEFSESPGESVLPNFAGVGDKIRAWSKPGRTLRLSQGERLLTAPSPGRVAGADMTYGVMDRSKEGRGIFLLRYSAKAAATVADAGNAVGLPCEITVTNGALRVTREGRPAAGAELALHVPGGKAPIEAKTNADGRYRLPAVGPGLVSIRAMVAEPTRGDWQGKSYELVRNYTTLTYRVIGNAKADPAAYALLEQAAGARESLPPDVAGVRGRVTFLSGGKEHSGTFAVDGEDSVEISVPSLDTDRLSSLRMHVASTFGHRRSAPFDKADGRHRLTFSGPDTLMGRRIAVHDRMKSAYRVRGDEITEVDRTIAGDRFIVTVLENLRTPEGKLLSKHFVVNHYDEQSGALTKTETYTDAFERIDGVWLPVSRRVVTAEAGRLSVRETRFSDLKVIRRSQNPG
jgi:hypothetical protein